MTNSKTILILNYIPCSSKCIGFNIIQNLFIKHGGSWCPSGSNKSSSNSSNKSPFNSVFDCLKGVLMTLIKDVFGTLNYCWKPRCFDINWYMIMIVRTWSLEIRWQIFIFNVSSASFYVWSHKIINNYDYKFQFYILL